ncbi:MULTISPECIES: hypothetical protein [unclassified Haloferax]|uniref:hypothetical protein n=1 Tax=unclassified Haloferax TaxID=2625095 RepID=UPI000E246526|nr:MULTISPECIES: hypothetical protein [unclassified Haloferax]RDZ33916.1 hypothetical protein C5B88_14650 [Haloferax sp. Atlit-24N]RLM33521.1 hypothetical protein DVK03_17715 [Haloferax sp. Atlit-109R]RLM40901.1 hypothetical protein DVK04_18605 [Haloferax sp. Atlit-105R]
MVDNADPLEGLYMNRDDFDRERLFSALSEIVGIDEETGSPVFLEPYYNLSNKERFVAQLLYRRAATSLGELGEDKEGANASEYAESLESSKSAVQNYGSELSFVESDDERGGYVISDHSVGAAIQFLEDEK